MTHLDLFSGIGGFAYAADQVFGDVEHIFCEIDPFCQQVIKKHWPESEIYDDIRNITNTDLQRSLEGRNEINAAERNEAQPRFAERPFILTGGFPCQPFSQAGVRRGTSDERYLWPEMLRVIRSFKPQWVIAENVSGLLTMQEGLVFEQVCLDLEGAGYEVQPLLLFQLRPSTPRTDGIESGLLPTADANMGNRGAATNTDKTRPSGHHKQRKLNDIAQMLPTPNARDEKNHVTERTPRIERKEAQGYTVDLNDTVGIETGMKLQPNFVAWMQGYPIGWTDISDV